MLRQTKVGEQKGWREAMDWRSGDGSNDGGFKEAVGVGYRGGGGGGEGESRHHYDGSQSKPRLE